MLVTSCAEVALRFDKHSRTDSRCEILDLRGSFARKLCRCGTFVHWSERPPYPLPTLQDGRTALHWAAFSGALDITQYLLEQKAEVDRIDGGGWTPLHIAGMHLLS